MNIAETAKVLAKVALMDGRDTSDLVILEWHDAVGHQRFDDAIAAVKAHRQGSTAYLLPAHINEHIRESRRRVKKFRPHEDDL